MVKKNIHFIIRLTVKKKKMFSYNLYDLFLLKNITTSLIVLIKNRLNLQ